MGKVIGVIIVLALAGYLAYRTCKSKSNDLFKWVLIACLVAFCFTWIFPYGYYSSGSYAESTMQRLGFTNIPTILYYGVQFCLTAVIYLFVIGAFYGIISKTKGYAVLVKKCSNLVKKNIYVSAVVTIVLLAGLSSVLTDAFGLLVFVPFLASVFTEAKTDKLTTMAITFGAILVGILGATIGTQSLVYFNSYAGVEVTTGLSYRIILGSCALVLYCVFVVLGLKRANKKVKHNAKEKLKEEVSDLFEVIETRGKNKVWPSIVIFAILFVVVILGFFDWSSVGVTAFTNFHKWLTELTIGSDFTIFSYVLGTSAVAFGSFQVTTLIPILIIMMVIIVFANGMSLEDAANNVTDGAKKMVKPCVLYILTYILFVTAYMTPFVPAITNWALGLTSSFNPFIMTVLGIITSIFHADLGYTGYSLGAMLQANYAANFDLVHTIYVYTYGLVQLFLPVGGLLLVGLSYFKLSYKSWIKYIWMFAVACLLIILILATIVTYC